MSGSGLHRKKSIDEGRVLPSAAQEWLTIGQLQDLLSIGHTKAYSLVASGEIPSVKIGRVIRINQRDLGDWLEQKKYRNVND